MSGLAPLSVGRLVTMSAVLGGKKTVGINELAGIRCGIGRAKGKVVAEPPIIVFRHLLRMLRALCGIVGGMGGICLPNGKRADDGTRKQKSAESTQFEVDKGLGKHRGHNSMVFDGRLYPPKGGDRAEAMKCLPPHLK